MPAPAALCWRCWLPFCLPQSLAPSRTSSSRRCCSNRHGVICSTLIIGGIVLLVVDKMRLQPRYHDAMDLPIATAFTIGLCQCLAMIPGVSRSGSSIVGGLLLGADKRAATEFSFFLAMPTMAGAFAYDLFKNYAELGTADVKSIALGFAVAFVAGVLVVPLPAGFRRPTWFRALRVVAHHCRRHRLGCARGARLTQRIRLHAPWLAASEPHTARRDRAMP